VPKGAEVVVTKDDPALVEASGRQLKMSGHTTLQLLVGSLQTTIDAWAVQDLPVSFLLGAPFIQKFVDLVVPWVFPCVVIFRGKKTVHQEPNFGSGIISLLAIFKL
jgi:hypothetical protein